MAGIWGKMQLQETASHFNVDAMEILRLLGNPSWSALDLSLLTFSEEIHWKLIIVAIADFDAHTLQALYILITHIDEGLVSNHFNLKAIESATEERGIRSCVSTMDKLGFSRLIATSNK